MRLTKIIITLLLAVLLPVIAHSKSREIQAEWLYDSSSNIAGYRLYYDNTLACVTNTPSATSMDCTVDAPDGEATFTLTTFSQDGTESSHSLPIKYVFTSNPEAVITSSTTSGESPLPVTFNANSSTGTIVSYEWMFGDGDVATGSSVNHTFSSAGNYTVTLKVTDNTGLIDQETVLVAVTSPTTVNIPPTAVIATTTSAGKAPLQVQFNGTASSDTDGSITTYEWDMGDGGAATGPQATYTYLSAGTYHPSLTVKDNGGLTNTISTPVIVQPSDGSNIPPNAVISASINRGKKPLAVTFYGGNSVDQDGEIVAYNWNFGDGKTSSHISVKHTFSKVAIYNITLTVTDDMGATSTPVYYTVTVINPDTEQPENSFLGAIYSILLGLQ